jgi:SAM-dependent methyltransferase
MTANVDQHTFWNTGPGGRNWSGHADDLDTVITAATGLLLGGLGLGPGMNVLDIGCGAGALALEVARAVGPDGQVLGIDFARPLLAVADGRLRAAEAANVRFVEADGQTFPFPPDTFDVVVSRFGVMFFDDSVAAFANIRSSLKPAGRIAFVAWASAAENPWFSLPYAAATARLGTTEPAPPGAPGPTAFAGIARVLGILSDAGFAEGCGTPRDIELHHPAGTGAVTEIARVIGPVAGVMRERGGTAEDLDAILADLTARLSVFETSDGIRIPARINRFQARNP